MEVVYSVVILGAFVMYITGIPGSLLVAFIASWVASGSFGEAIGVTAGLWFFFFIASLVIPWFLVLVLTVVGISAEGVSRLKRFGRRWDDGRDEDAPASRSRSATPPPLPIRGSPPPIPKSRGPIPLSREEVESAIPSGHRADRLEAGVGYCHECRAILRQWAKECIRCGTPRPEFR